MLIGEHISRYFVWDAMCSLDYLQSRSDIQPDRIGSYGCSGGGTVTAYFAALDLRVKAAGVGCYLTSEQQLLVSHGPQDAEQSIPGFIAAGLDFPDWVELFAPKPYAIISTTEDMFPYAGARPPTKRRSASTRYWGRRTGCIGLWVPAATAILAH